MSRPGTTRQLLAEFLDGAGTDAGLADVETFAALAALAPPLAPPPELRDRVLRAVAEPRYAVLDRMAGLLGIAVERARALLDSLDDALAWEPAGPGIGIQHLSVGPAYANTVVGLVRVAAGHPFPRHEHLGDEQVLVLQGGYEDESGEVYRAGDLVPGHAGAQHAFRALEGEELVYLAIVKEGVDFGPSGGPLVLPR
jgi:quercetin dioxygenase-like cupin family protein